MTPLLRFLLALVIVFGALQVGFWWGQAADQESCLKLCQRVIDEGAR